MKPAILALAILATAAPALAQQPDAKTFGNAVFEFGRTRYFRDLTRINHCEQVDPALFAKTNARFEAIRQALVVRFGDHFPAENPNATPIAPRGCDLVMLRSYGDHVTWLETAATAP